jgi:hypothetical protein
VVIFCNSQKRSIHFSVQLETKLDQLKIPVDVLNINGSLDKIDKFWRIRLFCDDCHSKQGLFCALVMTSASNVGIDKHSITLQVRFKWPRDLLTYFQEQGGGSQLQGAKSMCIVYGDFSTYIYLMGQLLRKSHNDKEEMSLANEVKGFNSAISPCKLGHR